MSPKNITKGSQCPQLARKVDLVKYSSCLRLEIAQSQVFTSRTSTLTYVMRDCAAYPILPSSWLKGLWLPQSPSFSNIEYWGSQRRVTGAYKTLDDQLLQLNFNLFNPIEITKYDAVNIGTVLDNSSIMSLISRLWGNHERSLERTWTNFFTIEISKGLCVSSWDRSQCEQGSPDSPHQSSFVTDELR